MFLGQKKRQNFESALLKSRAGTSLLIAVGLISVITLVSVGVSVVVVSSIRDSANVTRANEAFYAAEGALEKGLLANTEAGAGYNTTQPQEVDYPPAYSGCGAGGGQSGIQFGPGNADDCATKIKAMYEIKGQVPLTAKYNDGYGIPTPGTGTSGNNCDSIHPFVSGNFYYPPNNQNPNTSFPAQDHPCNWGKIKVGETVNIPLYITTSDASLNCPQDPDNQNFMVCNPKNLNLSTLKIKIRIPCSNGQEMCSAIDRYSLVESKVGAQFGGDPPIVLWEITGTNNSKSEIYSMSPVINYQLVGQVYQWPALTAVIHAGRINQKSASDFVVLDQSYKGIDLKAGFGAITDFLKNIKANLTNNDWDQREIFKPVLKLSVINNLEAQPGNINIPYLEYQVITNTNLSSVSSADAFQTITAEAFSSTFKQVLEVKKSQKDDSLEYVIQQ